MAEAWKKTSNGVPARIPGMMGHKRLTVQGLGFRGFRV